jgi:hypothetical protein
VPRVAALELGQLVGVVLDGVGEPQQQPPPLGGREGGPSGEGGGRCRHGPVDVFGPGLGHMGQYRAVVRIDDVEGRTRQPVDELPVDEEAGLHESRILDHGGGAPSAVVMNVRPSTLSQDRRSHGRRRSLGRPPVEEEDAASGDPGRRGGRKRLWPRH